MSLAAMTPFRARKRGTGQPRPARFLLGFGGHKHVKFQQDLASIRDDITSLPRAARKDGAVALGGHAAAAFGAVLPAARRVVKPGGMSTSRKPAGENAATGRTGRSSLGDYRARAENSQEFHRGAGPRGGC